MKKSELIQQMINIQKERKRIDGGSTITMDYIHYLEEQKRLVEIGDIELSEDKGK